ncbi:hypothetical protein K2P97_09970 [bacterium]|nr:hypothetical protein [bacterium]
MPQLATAQKKNKLNPFQTNLTACFGDYIDVQKVDSNKKLYKAIEQVFSLLTSETIYREVLFKQKGVLKKLKYENGQINIFSVDEEENLSPLSSEKVGDKIEGYELRQNQKPLTADARINQLLFRADIRSDLQKIKESRTKQMILNITWSDKQIKSLAIDFLTDKKTLTCTQKEAADICNCSG